MDALRTALRHGTRDAHERLDRCFRTLELTHLADYGVFLSAQAAALIPLEAALERAGIAAILPDWPDRCRSNAIRADVSRLGCELPEDSGTVDWIGDPAAMLGAAYVLEGSRLGGAMLRRHVLTAADARIIAAMDFLRHGEHARFWQSFELVLSACTPTQGERDTMIDSAVRSFALFEWEVAHMMGIEAATMRKTPSVVPQDAS